jgi:hypothetical protein
MAATDLWARQQTGLESPLDDGEQVTPSDSVDLTKVCRALHIGTGGDVVVITKGGTTLPLGNIASGTLYPIRASRVKSTGTTATGIVALW